MLRRDFIIFISNELFLKRVLFEAVCLLKRVLFEVQFCSNQVFSFRTGLCRSGKPPKSKRKKRNKHTNRQRQQSYGKTQGTSLRAWCGGWGPQCEGGVDGGVGGDTVANAWKFTSQWSLFEKHWQWSLNLAILTRKAMLRSSCTCSRGWEPDKKKNSFIARVKI